MTRAGEISLIVVAFLFTVAIPLATPAGAQSCIECHNPDGIAPTPPHDETCRDTSCLESCHAKNLARLRHPVTPLGPTRTEICNTCHNKPFPGVYHPYEIHVTAGSFTNPGMIDLNLACGQCHGGGDRFATTTGSIDAGSDLLFVADPTDFVNGNRVLIWNETDAFESSIVLKNGSTLTLSDTNPFAAFVDAMVEQNPPNNVAPYFNKMQLSLLADDLHGDKPYVTFSYRYVPPGTNRKHVEFNASQSSCKDADGYDTACTSYAWDFGDGSVGSGPAPTHLYAVGQPYTVTLTVTGPELATASATRTVLTFETYGIDAPPTVLGNDVTDCSNILAPPPAPGYADPNSWTAAIKDDSVDDNALTNVAASCSNPAYTDATPCKANGGTWTVTGKVTVKWGDSTMTDIQAAGTLFTHTYKSVAAASCAGADAKKILFIPGTTTAVTDPTTCALASGTWGNHYYVVHTAIDSIGQQAVKHCTIIVDPFTVSGTAYLNDTSTPLGGAVVLLKSGTTIVKSATSAPTTGAFTFTGVKPGTAYVLVASKTGVTFAAPVPVPAVGPSQSGLSIIGTKP